MTTQPAKKERLTIYLVKDTLADNVPLIKTEGAESPISIHVPEGEAQLFIKKEIPKPPPSWTQIFTSLPSVPNNAFGHTNSVGAILIYKLDRTFLLSFGHGFHLIREEVVERDFGLRVTLNSVEPEKLRSLDKASYEHNPLNHRTQSSKELDIFDLDMDSETEMLYAVTGASKEPLFGTHITGRDALTLAISIEIPNLSKVLQKALSKYSEALPPTFDWVDNVNRVRDSEDIDILDLLLNDELATENPTTFWLGEPEIVDWESQIGYSFDLHSKTPRYPTLEWERLSEYLEGKGQSKTIDTLKEQTIHVNNPEFQSIKAWSAYRCLYAEITDGTDHFLLRNGIWYKVSANFVAEINGQLDKIPVSSLKMPAYAHSREEDYNSEVASNDNTFHLMDKKTVAIGGVYDKIEYCDLIKNDKILAHVKHYRSSATLSHLFSQGHVAAETFIRDEGFRVRLNEKFPPAMKLPNPMQRPDASNYTVLYAIATDKKIPQELPFFSKVTLKNAFKTLRALNFHVEVTAIPIDPVFRKTAKLKPGKKKK